MNPNCEITVTLEPVEVEVATLVGTARQRANEAAGVQDKRRANTTSAAVHVAGIAAEFAFAKLTNCWPDLSIAPRAGGWDVMLHDGRSVDVKTTTHERGRLLATPSKRPEYADIYALMIGTLPTFRFAGWIENYRLLHSENLTDLGHGWTYALDQTHLHHDLPVRPGSRWSNN